MASLRMYRGDIKRFPFVLMIHENGFDRLLTSGEMIGLTLKFTAKRKFSDPDSAAAIALSTPTDITLNTTNSTCVVIVQPSLTENMSANGEVFECDLVGIDSSNKPHRFIVDKLIVEADVTRTVP